MRSKRALGTIAILREHGPLPVEELGRLLAQTGATMARDPVQAALDAVAHGNRFHELADGRWMDRLAALEDAVLLHRMTSIERRAAAIRMDPDLSVLSRLIERPSDWGHVLLAGVVELGWVRDRRLDPQHPAPERFLAIPYELARSLQPGDMIRAVAVEGSLSFEPVRGWRDPGDVAYPELEAAVGEALAPGPGEDPTEPASIDRILFETLGRAPDFLRSLREPVGAALRRCGLVSHRELVGTSLTRWAEHEWSEAAMSMAREELWEEERRDREPGDWSDDALTSHDAEAWTEDGQRGEDQHPALPGALTKGVETIW